MVTADDVRDNLHKIQELGPKGQYFVSIPNSVIGIVNKHKVESATASVAMKMFLAVLIPSKKFLIIIILVLEDDPLCSSLPFDLSYST